MLINAKLFLDKNKRYTMIFLKIGTRVKLGSRVLLITDCAQKKK